MLEIVSWKNVSGANTYEELFRAAGMRIQKMLDEGFIIQSALDGSLRIV